MLNHDETKTASKKTIRIYKKMALLGLTIKDKSDSKVNKKKNTSKQDSSSTSSQADEAKAMLEKMEAKKNADECPFC